jgi:prepilin signal peptidase PulO-like enzyme (type II secretory pathway)
LYVVSQGRWVGFGDVKLSIFIGVVLGWQKALLALILANVIGFFIVLPGLATRKLTRTSRVPFGPFLIIAFVVAGLFGDAIIQWYLSFVGL